MERGEVRNCCRTPSRLVSAEELDEKGIDAFLNNEWYSIHEEGEEKGSEMMDDRNIYTGERYKNIFEMRSTKYKYLLTDMKTKVKHYYFIRYEDLLNDYQKCLVFQKITNYNYLYVTQ
jgi:hypothetical protein